MDTERLQEREQNGYRTGTERVQNGYRTGTERIQNGYRTDIKRKWNRYGTVTNPKNGKSVLLIANYKTMRSSEHMLVL